VYGFLGNNAQNGVDPFGLDKNLPPGGNEFQPFPYFAPNMAIVSVVDPPPPKPSFGVSLIPVYGSWRSAAYESGQGNSFLAVFHTGMAVTDVALVKSAVVGLGKLGFKAGCKLLGLGGEKALEEIAAKEAGEQAVERLITREINKHHSFPKFLGGNLKQILSELSPAIHREFHQLLRQNLKEAGFPLDAANASAADWARYFAANPGAQEAAVKALAKTSFAIDAKYGTSITQDLLNNIGAANFTAH
jgi:hypothetical protein